MDYKIENNEDDIVRLKRVVKFLVDMADLPDNQKKVITDSLNRW